MQVDITAHETRIIQTLEEIGAPSSYKVHMLLVSAGGMQSVLQVASSAAIFCALAEEGASVAAQYPLDSLERDLRSLAEELRRSSLDSEILERDYEVQSSETTVVQYDVSRPIGQAILTSDQVCLLYDPDNNQLSAFAADAGPITWDLAQLMSPVVMGGKGIAWLRQCEWSFEKLTHDGYRALIARSGDHKGIELILTNNLDIIAASSAQGVGEPKFVGRFENVREAMNGDIVARGLYVGLQPNSTLVYAYAVRDVQRTAAGDYTLLVPSTALLFDFRAETKCYGSASRMSEWPPEMRSHVSAYDATSGRKPAENDARRSSGDRRGGWSWPLLCMLGVAAILLGAVVARRSGNRVHYK